MAEDDADEHGFLLAGGGKRGRAGGRGVGDEKIGFLRTDGSAALAGILSARGTIGGAEAVFDFQGRSVEEFCGDRAILRPGTPRERVCSTCSQRRVELSDESRAGG